VNTASLELCKELYELSGFVLTEMQWYKGKPVYNAPYGWDYPAYDLGSLLRKFAGKGGIELRYGDKGCIASSHLWSVSAETPEDAVCMLVIELFKRDILE